MNKSTKGSSDAILTLIAALVAVGASSPPRSSRGGASGVLRDGNGDAGLLAALALETLLVMSLGAFSGAIGASSASAADPRLPRGAGYVLTTTSRSAPSPP